MLTLQRKFKLKSSNLQIPMLARVIVSFSLILSASLSFAWDAVGHRIITEIAYRNLTCKARRNVDKVLGTRGIVYFSSWADEIKSDTIYPDSYGWHFQNLRSGMTREELDSLYYNKEAEGIHLFFALQQQETLLRENRRNADALKFIVHLMGDAYQPMHVGRPEDKGGNKVQVRWFGNGTNLHSLWDGRLISYAKYSYMEYADYLCDRFGNEKKDIMHRSPEECIWQTYLIQNEIYAYQDKDDNNSYHYAYHFRPLHDRQLYVAGIRLAKLLNSIYK